MQFYINSTFGGLNYDVKEEIFIYIYFAVKCICHACAFLEENPKYHKRMHPKNHIAYIFVRRKNLLRRIYCIRVPESFPPFCFCFVFFFVFELMKILTI